MRTQMTVLAIAGLACGAHAQTVIDFNDLGLVPGQPFTFTVEQTDPGPLLGFSWELTYTAINPSWGSELNIALTHESGFSFTFDGSDGNFADLGLDDVSFGWGNFSQEFMSVGAVVVQGGPNDTLGIWTITVSDEFPDTLDVEGVLSGSITVNKVPAPGGLAALGLAGTLGLRRRRRA